MLCDGVCARYFILSGSRIPAGQLTKITDHRDTQIPKIDRKTEVRQATCNKEVQKMEYKTGAQRKNAQHLASQSCLTNLG